MAGISTLFRQPGFRRDAGGGTASGTRITRIVVSLAAKALLGTAKERHGQAIAYHLLNLYNSVRRNSNRTRIDDFDTAFVTVSLADLSYKKGWIRRIAGLILAIPEEQSE